MYEDIVLQLLDTTPRRPLSVFGVLRGRKTASVLFAGLEYGILQWRGLLEGLSRQQFLQQIEQLTQRGLTVMADERVYLTPLGVREQVAARERTVLPENYHREYDATKFTDRFFLGVQVVSEGLAQNRQYAPVTSDWGTQTWVRNWYRQWHKQLSAIVDELTAAFTALPEAQADYLARQLVGHAYNGSLSDTAETPLTGITAMSSLLNEIATKTAQYPALAMLWGGPVTNLSQGALACVARFKEGVPVATIATQVRRKESTINEYIQLEAMLGTPINPAELMPQTTLDVLTQAWQQGIRDYQTLMQRAESLTFMQVRLFQIWQLRKESQDE